MRAEFDVMADIRLTEADEAILDRLTEEGQSVPARLAEQTGYDRQYVYKRLKRMDEHEIVEGLGHGLYRLKNDPRE
jgi:DNA-binding IclR family transcriptional regulator